MKRFWNKIKRFWHWLTIIVVGGVVVASQLGNTPIVQPASTTPGYFAQIDANGIVQRVIVISQADINTGKWGDPATWIETSKDGSIRKNPAGIGSKYDQTLDAFRTDSPYPSWTLDTQTAKWKAPKVKPAGSYEWDENKQNWVKVNIYPTL